MVKAPDLNPGVGFAALASSSLAPSLRQSGGMADTADSKSAEHARESSSLSFGMGR